MAGRPKKIPLKRKMYIVERYLAEKCAGDRNMLKKHGIYTNLVKYARDLETDLTLQDFTNDDDIRKYIDNLATSTPTVCVTTDAFPVYIPLDIISVVNASTEKQEQILRNREDYYQRFHEKASRIFAERSEMEERVAGKDRIIQELHTKLEEHKGTIHALNVELRNAQMQCQDLRRIIRKTIEPSRAEALINSVTTREEAIEYSRKYIEEPFGEKKTPPKDTPSSEFRKHLKIARDSK